MKPVRVGVVGVGYLGQFHAEKYAHAEGVTLVGVVDIDSARAHQIARRFGVRPFTHHSALFGLVDAVSIAVPTPLHHSIAKDFLLQGIDVLVEKPIACTIEEADELIEISETCGRILQVGHVERYNGALLAVENKIHRPLLIEAQRMGPFLKRATETDVVLDLMIHDIDLALSWVRSGIEWIHAIGAPVLTSSIDVASVRMQFENGCVADLTASRVSRERVRCARILQPGSYLTIDYLKQKATYSERRFGHAEIVFQEIPVSGEDPLEREIRSFVHCVRERKDVRASGREARRALEVALRVVREIDEFIDTRELRFKQEP